MSSLLPSARTWLATPTASAPQGASAPRQQRLVAAVSAIVGIAGERARAAGHFGAVRDAVERALDAVAPPARDPRDAEAAELPRISDADPTREEARLRALLARRQPG